MICVKKVVDAALGVAFGDCQQHHDEVFKGTARLEELFARIPTADEVRLLQLPGGEPVVELHRTTYTADGTVVEYAIGVHAASRFAWEYDFKVPDSAQDREAER